MNICTIVFSPTGSTARVADILAGEFAQAYEKIDLSLQDFQPRAIENIDLAIIVMPTFAGRLPQIAEENLLKVRGQNTLAVLVSCFGNRHFDDALLELKDRAQEAGFKVIGGIGASVEHSIFRDFGRGRPDRDDKRSLEGFAREISRKITAENFSLPAIPGNRPYINRRVSTIRPIGDEEKCTKCMKCQKTCPLKAIPSEEPWTTSKDRCIACMRCISLCPVSARYLHPLVRQLGNNTMRAKLESRKEYSLYL